MKQGLQLRFSQNLALTPQLQQSIRLLQLSTQELNQELESILQNNPLLERDERSEDGDAGDGFNPASSVTSSQQEAPRADDIAPQESFGEDFTEFAGSTRWEDSGSGSNDDHGDYVFQEAAPE